MKFNSFLKECQDKEVFKKLSIYAVFSWLFIQVVSVLQLPMGLPQEVVTYALILLLIGFPIYIFYIWKYQIEPIHKQEVLANGEVPAKRGFFGSKTPFQRYYFLSVFVISSLIALVLFFVIRNNFLSEKETSVAEIIPSEIKTSDKIGVLKFGNNTGNDSLDIIGKMTADWIIHGITQEDIAQVVSPQIVEDYTTIIKARLSLEEKATVLQDYFKPAQIVSGNFYQSGNKLIFQCTITDGKLDKTLISLDPVSCDSKNPLECIEELKQRILGYFITVDTYDDLEEIPPKYEAYKLFLEAKNASTYDENTIKRIEEAIAIDSEYFEPRIFQLTYYYDQENYKKADSILNTIAQKFNFGRRQQNIIQLYSALLEGNNRNVYRHVKEEYNLAPFDLNTNASMLVVAMQYVNKPEVIDSVFQVVDTRDSDAENCYSCSNRIYIKTIAELELKHYDSVLHYASKIFKYENQQDFLKPMAAAYLHLGKKPMDLLKSSGLRLTKEQESDFLLYTGTQSLILGDQDSAKIYFNALYKLNNSDSINFNTACAAYYSRDLIRAKKEFQTLKQRDSLDLDVIGFLANTYAKLNTLENAQQEIQLLKSMQREYQFGKIEYLLARYYAVLQDDTQVFHYLNRAVAAGSLYTSEKYQYDPHFTPYLSSPEFHNVMTYWH